MKDYHRRVLQAAQQLGIERAHIEHRGERHPRLVGWFAGRELRYVVAFSPRATCAHKPAIAGLRRYLATVANDC